MKIKKNQKLKIENFSDKRVFVQFENVKGEKLQNEIDIQLDTNLNTLNATLQKLTSKPNESFSLFYKNYQIQKNLSELIREFQVKDILNEKTIVLSYLEDSLMDIKPITRISSSMEGHTQAVLEVSFSPDGNYLASVSGDKSLRLWDVHTETPYICLEGHEDWSMIVSWAPDSQKIITSDKLGNIYTWKMENIKTGKKKIDKQIRENRKLEKNDQKLIVVDNKKVFNHKMKGHKNYVTSLSWRPYHLDENCNFFVSSSKDCSVRFWNFELGKCFSQSSIHKKSVTKIIWGGQDLIYSVSQDQMMIIWDSKGQQLHQLSGHAHWINCLAINTFYSLQSGYLDYNNQVKDKESKSKLQIAKEIYQKSFQIINKEIVVTGSDDNTIIVWHPQEQEKKVHRLTGHTGPINNIQFAPNTVFFVSASFDKTLRIWSIHNHTCLGVLRGHVSAVYVLSFSRDSKWVISGSKDSTLQVWNAKEKKRAYQLPGHADQIYSVGWSLDGTKMASGGKDKMFIQKKLYQQMIETSYTISTQISIYITSLAGIFFCIMNLWNLEKTKQQEYEELSSEDSNQKIQKVKFPNIETSQALEEDEISENVDELKSKEDKPLKFLPIQELNFFRELGYFFIKENKYFVLLLAIFSPIVLAATFFWLHWFMGICFIIGYVEFYLNYWYVRKLFIKTMIRLKLNNDNISLKHYNWNLFSRFLSSSLMVQNISTTVFCSFFILDIFNLLFTDDEKVVKNDLNNLHGDNTTSHEQRMTSANITKFQIFVLCYAFYLVGKNLLSIFDSIWFSFHENRTTLNYLKSNQNRAKKLASQSNGLYFNIMGSIQKHNIILTEVIVLGTICLAEYKTGITVFFIWLSAAILMFFLGISLVSIFTYKFKHVREIIKMTNIFDAGFLYYFQMAFVFLFYQFFIYAKVLTIKRGSFEKVAGFNYEYIIVLFIWLLHISIHYFFVPSYQYKKNKKFQMGGMYRFPINQNFFVQMFYVIACMYLAFLNFGYLAIIFLFFFLSVSTIFHRMKIISSIFNTYIKTLLHFCGICSIHHINFNKIYSLTDKSYHFNYAIMLFSFPLYRLNDLQRVYGYSYFQDSFTLENFFHKLGLIVVSMIISILLLCYYTRVVANSIKKIDRSVEELSTRQKILNTIKERHFFFIMSILAYMIYLYLFYFYMKQVDILCIILGFSIHFFQIIWNNKIIIKKFWQTPYKPEFSENFVMQINKELYNSPYYVQTLCELSFANILLEVCKVFLLTQFIFHFIQMPWR